MKSYYVSAFAAEILTQAGMLATLYVIGTALSATAVLEYALVRRIFSLIFPLCILGFDTGLARFGWEYRHCTSKLIGIVFRFSLPLFFLIASISLIFQQQTSILLFGSSSYSHFVLPLLILTLGSIFHACAYNIYRGLLRTHIANGILVLNHGIAPLALVFLQGSIDDLLVRLGIVWIISSTCFLIPLLRTNEADTSDYGVIRTITSFSLKRFPADLLGIAFFSLPVIITAHMWNVTVAGQLAIGISLIGMAGSAFSPFNVVFLPHISRLVHEHTAGILIRKILPLVGIFFVVLLIVFTLGEIFLAPIIAFLFHSHDPGFIALLRLLLIGILPYSIYCIGKSLIDTHKDGSLNSVNMASTLLFLIIQFTTAWIFQMSLSSFILAIVTSLILLSFLTLRDVRRCIASMQI